MVEHKIKLSNSRLQKTMQFATTATLRRVQNGIGNRRVRCFAYAELLRRRLALR